jgi:hypothetical protein
MGYIAEMIEEDPTVQMKELYKEIESKRFDAKNIHREQEDLLLEIEKARAAIAVFELFMKNMKVRK